MPAATCVVNQGDGQARSLSPRSGRLDRIPGAPFARAGRHADVISGTAFLFDQYQNLVITPQPVKFDLSVNGQSITRTEMSKDGVAYIKLDSSKKEGPGAVRRLQRQRFGAPRRAGGRVRPVQHSHEARLTKEGILVSTDPIHDCSGNPVPDGTIVTFTSTDANGRSTVDARIKQGHRAGHTAGER